jgi:hypothetical protein
METTIKIIDASLYILIYGFSYLFILTFILEIQAAFISHLSGYTQCQEPTVELKVELENQSEYQLNLQPESNLQPVNITLKSKTAQLRNLCEKENIDWYYTSFNPKTKRKRHLTVAEMEIALQKTKPIAV